MIGDREQTREQERQLLKDFIRLYCKGRMVDGIQVVHALKETWGLHADWHDTANVMEDMVRYQMATVRRGSGPDGFDVYLIK